MIRVNSRQARRKFHSRSGYSCFGCSRPGCSRPEYSHPERGSTLLVTIFYGVLALALILTVTLATSLYLERKRLFTLADAAALAGAEAFSAGSITGSTTGSNAGPAAPPPITAPTTAPTKAPIIEPTTASGALRGPALRTADVEAAVSAFLVSAPHDFDQLTLLRAESVDGTSATVELAAVWRPVVVSIVAPGEVRLHVTSTARAVFW